MGQRRPSSRSTISWLLTLSNMHNHSELGLLCLLKKSQGLGQWPLSASPFSCYAGACSQSVVLWSNPRNPALYPLSAWEHWVDFGF